jgi:hypothetical protein
MHWILGVHHLWFRVQLHSLCTESSRAASVGSLSAASEELQWPAWQLCARAHCTVSTIDILEKGGGTSGTPDDEVTVREYIASKLMQLYCPSPSLVQVCTTFPSTTPSCGHRVTSSLDEITTSTIQPFDHDNTTKFGSISVPGSDSGTCLRFLGDNAHVKCILCHEAVATAPG